MQFPAEFRAIEDGYDLTVVGNGRFDVGLMEGFLTLSASTKTEYSIGRFYDHDPTIGRVLWWNGKSYQYNNPLQGAWDDSHTGTDYDMNYGEKILAPAPGIVVYLRNGSIGESSEESSNLTEMDIEYSNGFRTALFHFSKSLVNVNDKVVRGQPVAEVGDLGTFYPHSHGTCINPANRVQFFWILINQFFEWNPNSVVIGVMIIIIISFGFQYPQTLQI